MIAINRVLYTRHECSVHDLLIEERALCNVCADGSEQATAQLLAFDHEGARVGKPAQQ